MQAHADTTCVSSSIMGSFFLKTVKILTHAEWPEDTLRIPFSGSYPCNEMNVATAQNSPTISSARQVSLIFPERTSGLASNPMIRLVMRTFAVNGDDAAVMPKALIVTDMCLLTGLSVYHVTRGFALGLRYGLGSLGEERRSLTQAER